MTITAVVEIDLLDAADVVEAINFSQTRFDREARAIIERGSADILNQLRSLDPPSPRPRFPGRPYPLPWTSERQRRAFFATNGFGGGIPHRRRRPSQVQQGWRTEYIQDRNEGIYRVLQTWENARFVIGLPDFEDDQQIFHQIIGWATFKTIDDVIEQNSEMVNDQLEDAWLSLEVFS
jgi:hypothetical protein